MSRFAAGLHKLKDVAGKADPGRPADRRAGCRCGNGRAPAQPSGQGQRSRPISIRRSVSSSRSWP